MKYLLIFTFFIGFNACTHLYYMPDIRTVPIHSDEGDITLNANTGYGGAIAYSYTDNIFSNIAVSHFESKNFIDKNLPFEDKSSFTRYDLGFGYNFTPKIIF